jgi:hypothetical protein
MWRFSTQTLENRVCVKTKLYRPFLEGICAADYRYLVPLVYSVWMQSGESANPICFASLPEFVVPPCVGLNDTQVDVFERVIGKTEVLCDWRSPEFACVPVRSVQVYALVKWLFCFPYILFFAYLTCH